MRRPLVWMAVFYSCGIFAATFIKSSCWLIFIPAVMLFILTLLSARKRRIFDVLLLFLVFVSGITAFMNQHTLPRCHVSRYAPLGHDQLYTLKGFVANPALSRDNRTSFVLEAQEIKSDNLKYNCCGKVLVYIQGRKDFPYGQVLTLSGNLCRPFNFLGGRKQGYRDYLANQGIFSILRVRSGRVVQLNENRGALFKRIASRLTHKTEEVMLKDVSPVAASILSAMVLGARRNIPSLINDSLVKSGTVHILVVSGFNVGLVSFALVLLLRVLRLPRRTRFCIAIALAILYCYMTGASTPVVRATVMAIVFMAAYLLRREPDIYNSLALAAIFILWVSPAQLFDVGFQLSFASVISIACLYPGIKSFLRLDRIRIRPIRYLAACSLVSFSAWLGTLGLVAYNFRIISLVTVLANLFMVPLASLITLSGFSLLIMELTLPALAPLFALSSEFLIALLLRINALLVKLPGAYFYLS